MCVLVENLRDEGNENPKTFSSNNTEVPLLHEFLCELEKLSSNRVQRTCYVLNEHWIVIR